MEKSQFWRLIKDAKARSGGDCDRQVEILKHSLMRLPPEEIIAFDKIYDEFRDLAYRWDLRGAAVLIIGGSEDI